jgi:hypothetical protein
MESRNENGRFPKIVRKIVSVLLRFKGTLEGKDIIISIAPTLNCNYVSVECANQLLIHESNIMDKINSWNEKEYDISNLQLNIGDYTLISQFTVTSLLCDDSDIVLGSP